MSSDAQNIFAFNIRSVTNKVSAELVVWTYSMGLLIPTGQGQVDMTTNAFLEMLEKFQDQAPFSSIYESSDLNALKGLAGLASGEMREHILQEIERIPKALEAKKTLASEGERS